MKLKKIAIAVLAAMTMATGAMGITANASGNSFTFSLSTGGSSPYTAAYSVPSGQSAGSVRAYSGVSSSDYCNAALYSTAKAQVTNSVSLTATNRTYHPAYTTYVSSACMKLTNTRVAKTVSGYWSTSNEGL